MRVLPLLSLGCVLGCSPQPQCTYVVCTQDVAQACGQLQVVADACGPPSSTAVLSDCESDLAADCSEAESTALANATGCFGSSTPCPGAVQAIQACFAAQSLSSGCRSAVQGQIKVFLPDGG